MKNLDTYTLIPDTIKLRQEMYQKYGCHYRLSFHPNSKMPCLYGSYQQVYHALKTFPEEMRRGGWAIRPITSNGIIGVE